MTVRHLLRDDDLCAVTAGAARIAATTGGSVAACTDHGQAVGGADVLATDSWVSMGQEGLAAGAAS